MFEILTGDLLFDPHADAGGAWGEDEDHLAQCTELLGTFPRAMTLHGKVGWVGRTSPVLIV